MKNINLTFIILIAFVQVLSAQSSQHNMIEGTRTEAEYQKFGLLKNTDNFSFKQKHDTTILVYKSFSIAKKSECTSEEIFIYPCNSVMSEKTFLGDYFLGIINDRYAIFDEGTSNIRGLMIYDLIEEREVLDVTYYLDLKLENNSIYFDTKVEIKDENLKPKCPPEIEDITYKIYLEKQYFDFDNLSVVHTGEYKCACIE